MKNSTLLISLLACACLAYAQEASRFEIFGGYAFSNRPRLPLAAISSDHGWEAAFKYNITSRIGLVAEIDGRTGSDFRVLQPSANLSVFVRQPVSTYTYLFGPEFNVYRNRRVAFNLRGLAGFIHADDSGTSTSVFSTDPITGQQQFVATRSLVTNTFAASLGGNIDVRLGRGFSWRALQPEAVITRPNGREQVNLRVATGLVFGFGKR
ncbi:MAG TPA: hypothetical protein VGV35_11265 [Bryobacteraceae bacterium]|nr:hypothetical protein [Bryobacteraceae bacterium]